MRYTSRITWLFCLFWMCASANIALAQSSDIGVTKSGPGTASAGANVSLTYNISVTNFGPDASDTVTLSDPIPAGMVFSSMTSDPAFSCTTPGVGNGGTINCTVATMLNGATANFSLTLLIPSATPGASFTNIASVSCSTDLNSENDSATSVTLIPAPQADAYVIKTGASAVPPNVDIPYTIVVGNNGPDAAPSVSWSDSLPSGLPSSPLTFVSLQQNSGPAFSCVTPAAGVNGSVSCSSIGSIAAGASATFTLTAHVPSATPSGTSYTNAAFVQLGQDASGTQDPDPENDSATTTAFVSNADVALSKTAPATAVAGQNLAYTLTLSNNGPDPAIAAQFLDNLPTGISFVSLVQNSGPAAACNTFVSSASCTIGLLASGASASFTLTVHAAANIPNATVITNTATASSTSFDPNTANNSASASTTIQNTADLSIVKTGPASAAAGSNATYALTLSNAGPDAATSASLSDTLPAGMTFVSLVQNSGPAATCVAPAVGSGGTVSCSIATLAAGAGAQFTLVGAISTSVANGSTINNSATASSSSTTPAAPDPNPANNAASANTLVSNAADLVMSKTGPSSVLAGQTINYALTLSNTGASPAISAQWSDTLPAGTTFVSLTQTVGSPFTCATPAVGSGGSVTCTIASLAPGANASFGLIVAVSASLANGSTLVNTAIAQTTSADLNPANNSMSATTTVNNTADLVMSKSGPSLASPGQNVSYSLGLINAGTSSASAVQWNDPLPAGTKFVSLVQTAGPAFNCTPPAVGSGGTVTCNIATLASGASATFTLVVDTTGAAFGTLVNTATASSSTLDSNPANNVASASVSLVPAGVPAPTLSSTLLLLLALLVTGTGVIGVRRSR